MVQYMKVPNEYTYIKAAMNSLEEKFIACVSDCFVNRIQNYSRNVISTGILGAGMLTPNMIVNNIYVGRKFNLRFEFEGLFTLQS